jgi:hypothetical protein
LLAFVQAVADLEGYRGARPPSRTPQLGPPLAPDFIEAALGARRSAELGAMMPQPPRGRSALRREVAFAASGSAGE